MQIRKFIVLLKKSKYFLNSSQADLLSGFETYDQTLGNICFPDAYCEWTMWNIWTVCVSRMSACELLF